MIPGPSRLPILGSLVQMGIRQKKFPVPHIMLQDFCREYGPIVTLQYGMKRQGCPPLQSFILI